MIRIVSAPLTYSSPQAFSVWSNGSRPTPLRVGRYSWRTLLAGRLVGDGAHDALVHEAGEAVRQHAAGDTEIALDLVEAPGAEEELAAQHKDGPHVAEFVHCGDDRAAIDVQRLPGVYPLRPLSHPS